MGKRSATSEFFSTIILSYVVATSLIWKGSSLFGTKYLSFHRKRDGYCILSCRVYATARVQESGRDLVVAVIGGGAAGVFSAIQCAQVLSSESSPSTGNWRVVVLESGHQPLSKVLISGGGRCNVMHDPTKPINVIVKGYPRGTRELVGPFSKTFGPRETFDWFQERLRLSPDRDSRVTLKTEGDGRVFPSTDNSSTIVHLLKTLAEQLGVQIQTGVRVTKIHALPDGNTNSSDTNRVEYEGKSFRVESSNQSSKNCLLNCDRVIMATGSTRSGYDMMKRLGHSLSEPLPSLFSFRIEDSALTELSGISVQFAKVQLVLPGNYTELADNKKLLREAGVNTKVKGSSGIAQSGPLLITMQGLSGPAVLKLSAFAAKILNSLKYRFEIEVNWTGDLTLDEVLDLFEREKKTNPNRSIGKRFPPYDSEDSEDQAADASVLITRRLWLFMLSRCNVTAEAKLGQVDRPTLLSIAKRIVADRYLVSGRGQYKDEFVTCGGVSLKEVNMDTLESKVVSGLYIAGEVLDIDGITGGYNFQSAWTTGFIAGKSCAKSLLHVPAIDGNRDYVE